MRRKLLATVIVLVIVVVVYALFPEWEITGARLNWPK